jgi:CRP/FNR family transcriptional regulator, cyclic AMP receptor protein
MKTELETALTAGWLSHIDPDIAKRIIEVGKPQRFSDGQTITTFGEDHYCIFGVLRGAVKMFVTMNEQPPRFAHVVGTGFWFGEHEILSRAPRIMEMTASGETLLIRVNRRDIDHLAEAGLDVWMCLYSLAVMNQGLAIGAADDLLIRNSRQRLAAVLLRLGSFRNAYQGVPPMKNIPATWTEISEISNLSRSKLASLLSEFTRRGLISTGRKSITLLAPDRLERLCQNDSC